MFNSLLKVKMEEHEESSIEKITDTVGDLVTGIPAPIRKNFFKACGKLCTALVDVPVAKLESRANEIRAESKARTKIIETVGEQVSEQFEVPIEYISKAAEKFASKVIREQLNIDQIGMLAANNLKNETFEDNDHKQTEEISDDWLNEFEHYARLKSSDDMKLIFGKILSGEIQKPGTFSIRTVRLISQLDNQAAQLFQRLCSMSISLCVSTDVVLDSRVVSLAGNAGSNSLSKYGLSFDNLNILHEYGLIISDYNSWMGYSPCIAGENGIIGASIHFGGLKYGFVPTDKEKYDKELKLHGVAFTKAGKELLKIVPQEEVSNYKQDFIEFFTKKHLKIVEAKFK